MLGLFTTNSCNLRCIYCSTNGGKPLNNELSLKEKIYVIDQAKDLGAKLINLHGSGEPMMDKDFFKLIEHINNIGLQALVVTNGTFIGYNTARWMYRNKVCVLFKMNTFDKNSANLMVGKKNAYRFEKYSYFTPAGIKNKMIPSGLKNLIQAGYADLDQKKFITPPLQIHCLISKYNYKEIPEIASFCKDNNIYLFLDRIIPDGRAVKNHKKLCLNEGEYSWLYKQLSKTMGLRFVLRQKSVICTLKGNPLIKANGDMVYCVHRPGIIGNIRKDDFESLCLKFKKLHKTEALSWKAGLLNRHFKTCAGREYLKKQYDIRC